MKLREFLKKWIDVPEEATHEFEHDLYNLDIAKEVQDEEKELGRK